MQNFGITGINFKEIFTDNKPIYNPLWLPSILLQFGIDNSKAQKDIVGLGFSPFSHYTSQLMSLNIPHKTKLLDVAESLLGLQEVTAEEYKMLPPNQRKYTHMRVIGKYGTVDHKWCAHTVSYICEQAGINIGGHKAQVSQFITWAKNKNIYNPIATSKVTKQNYIKERANRLAQIKRQLTSMTEGDLIIWKTDYAAKNDDGSVSIGNSSHIGIIEHVDLQSGVVTVIEGNANEPVTGKDFERSKVKNAKEGINGNQGIGEQKEINRRDGLIRKQYTIEQLANFGYSGYIDMQGLVK